MKRRPLLLGHRGSRDSAAIAENTFGAFDLALEHGCDGFEFDVRLARDGSAVVCHDAELDGIPVSSLVPDQIRPLPLLNDVLARYADRAFLNIELKVPGLAPELLAALNQHPPQRGYLVSSFLPDVLLDLRMHFASIPLGIICDKREQLSCWRELPVEYVIPRYPLITRKLLRELTGAGKKIFAWTVNGKASMLRLASWGIDGIISDKTALLARTFPAAAQGQGNISSRN